MRELNDRLRDHLDDAAPPIDVDRLVRYLAAAGRTDDMRVSTLEPELETPPPTGRRIRIGLVFAAAAVITVVAVGLAGWLFGGADPAGDPSDVSVTVEEPPVTQPPEPETKPEVTPPPVTTEEPVTTLPLPPEASVLPIDPDVDLDWAQPSVALDADGTPLVLYQRDDSTIAYAACDGPECAAPIVTDVHEASGRVGWVIGTPRPGLGPVFWAQNWRRGVENISSALVLCGDAACADPDVVSLRESEHGVGLPSLTVTPEGAPIVLWPDMVEPGAIIVMACSDATCSGDVTTHRVWTAGPGQWIGGGSAAVADGPPIVAFSGSESLFIGTCREGDCGPGGEPSGFESMVEVPLPGAPSRSPRLVLQPGGSPTAVALVENGRFEDVVVVACESPQCLDPVVTILGTVDDSFGEWDAALGADARLRVAWTEVGVLHLATCADTMCTSFEAVALPHPARDVALAIDADGHPILATSNPDRGVELVICGDERCTFAP